MISNATNRFPAPTAEELAVAMREGLEARRFYRTFPPSRPDAVPPLPPTGLLSGLLDIARATDPTHLRDIPLAPGRGFKGRLIRLLRRAARKVMRPWFDHQSVANACLAARMEQFDRAVLHHLEALNGAVAALTRQIQQEVAPGYMAANSRLNECFHDLYRLRQALQGEGTVGPAAIPSADGIHVIEGLFLHTRLPAPPARVLTLAATHALDLASLGFQVVTGSQADDRHPDLRCTSGCEAPTLPFPDSAFEVIVALSGDGVGAGATTPWTATGATTRAELARVLVSGGVVIGSVRVAGDPPSNTEIAALVAPFRLVEVVHAARAGDGWALHPGAVDGTEATLWVAVRQ